jgi:hypothetical protein
MATTDLLKPWQACLGLLGLLYGALLVIQLPNTWFWFGVDVLIVVGMVLLMGVLEYPFVLVWPAFVGVFLLLACVVTLWLGVHVDEPLPISHSMIELGVMCLLALGFVSWGVVTARKTQMDY